MKKGWKTVPLEAVALQQKGAIKIGPFGSQLKKSDLASSGIHVVGIENVLSERFDGLGERFISPEKFQSLKTVEILPGDLLITMMGTIGKVAVVPDGIGTSIMDSHLLRVRPDTCVCRTDYLKWAIYGSPAVQESMDAQAHGSIMKGLNSAIVRSLPIVLPPLHEQQRLVRILDEAFEGIATVKANAEKNLQKSRALFESYLQSVFTQHGSEWLDSTIGESIRFIDYRGKTPTKTSSGIRLITAKNVKMGYLQATPMEFIASTNYNDWMTRGIPKKGDVLFTTEAPLGNVAQLDTEEKVAFAQRIIIMQPNSAKLDSTFLKYLMLSQPVQRRIRNKGTGATAQGIKASLLKTIEISFPKTLMEQMRIVTKLNIFSEETQRLASLYQRKLVALEALKKSLLHQAFSGEL